VRQIKLTSSQLSSVNEYCKLNNIEDVDKFITKCYTEGFNITKYGLLGDDSGKTGIVGEKQVEIEVIREIRVEVPVEVIKYVDREVPIEVIKEIIKEVPVDRIVEVIKEVIVEVPVTNLDNICDKPEPIIIEKIVEIIKEVPVETIVEIEKIIEKIVEVEKVVEVEKSNDKMTMLQETLQTLRKELNSKTDEIKQLKEINKQLESIKLSQGAVYMKGSNLNENL
jgi:hypothetical protein